MEKRISQAGTYHVTIRNPHWTKLEEKDGDDCRMAAVLPGFCTIKGEEYEIIAEQYFLRTIYASGKNAGKTMAEISKENLLDIGMPEPFNPTDIKCLEGVEVKFVVEMEDYKGKSRPKVQFINSLKRQDKELPSDEASRIWNEIAGNPTDKDIPF